MPATLTSDGLPEAMDCRGLLATVVVLRLQTTLFDSISRFTKYNERKGGHSPLLLGVESLIERLPRIGELLKVGRSLGQGIGASTHEVDRIAVAQGFDRTTFAQLTGPCCLSCDAGLAVLRPGANGVLDSGPVFFLVRCQLQRGLDDINPRIRQGAHVGCAQALPYPSRRGLRISN